ncbi:MULTISPECIES: DUF3014 domain-containing protein [unclassified Wenzhouxiangella]|uniref:DUF3014 domain-containing protein n=1 Tax=unclassified Wenzhouxiangella TaxID=2613841 RepID=UPI000E325288|nr:MULTISPECIES: DUF3014 domain-containing protein [unclassified Wenzhouxiangella]RFF26636.1 DUF3014 domain-containing protein [Wenzhouxiangella sp. 15181]RFP67613.1 DUF3014 domain-containing protein [Wenzhouxiangella sp. 15190]
MRWIISVLVVLALVAGLWWMEQQRQAELVPEADLDIPAEPEQPEPRHPLPEPEPIPTPDETMGDDSPEASDTSPEAQPEPEPLPDLADSDTAALEALASLLGNDFVQQWIKPEFVIPRAVSVINSLEGEAPALKSLPVRTLDTEPLTEESGDGEKLLWTEANTARYESLVASIESIPADEAAMLYRRYYPLFQEAWQELGETEPYFNDRLIDVVDHLLATPEVELPFEVVPYEGRLHFADEALQEESWGRKLLIRMGPDQAAAIKQWLRDFRQELAAPPEGEEEKDFS